MGWTFKYIANLENTPKNGKQLTTELAKPVRNRVAY
jgi:hypothetical protein